MSCWDQNDKGRSRHGTLTCAVPSQNRLRRAIFPTLSVTHFGLVIYYFFFKYLHFCLHLLRTFWTSSNQNESICSEIVSAPFILFYFLNKSIFNSDCLWIIYADVSIVFVIAGLYGYCLFSNY